MTAPAPDFAAAAMMRLIRHGLERQGLSSPNIEPGKGAWVELKTKRDVTAYIRKTHGPLALLQIGSAIKDAPHEPALTAMVPSADPFDLLKRWQRLERYTHSRHRTELVEIAANQLVIRHYARRPHPPPREEEDLLIFGLLAALFELIGVTGLTAGPSDQEPWLREGSWQITDGASSPLWVFDWQKVSSRPQFTSAASTITNRLRSIIAQDPARSWTIEAAARALTLSKRTLQRRLAAEGAGFAPLLCEVRAAAAAQALRSSELSLAAIGFTCGYADQAHFAREFKRISGVTPLRYRSEFG